MNKKKLDYETLKYFKSENSIKDLYNYFEKNCEYSIDKYKFNSKKTIIISNHPYLEKEYWIEGDKIKYLKGGNTYNYPYFHFPAIRQFLIEKTFGNKIYTLANDIGWNKAMEETNHLLINPKGKNRTEHIIKQIKERNINNLMIFPEGKVTNLSGKFSTGFLYIAKSIGVEKIIISLFKQKISLYEKNELKIIDEINISNLKPSDYKDFANNLAQNMLKFYDDIFK